MTTNHEPTESTMPAASESQPRTHLGRLAAALGLGLTEVSCPPGSAGSAPWESVRLTTIGSRNVTVTVVPVHIDDASAVIWLGLHDGPLAIAVTEPEARWLIGALQATFEELGA